MFRAVLYPYGSRFWSCNIVLWLIVACLGLIFNLPWWAISLGTGLVTLATAVGYHRGRHGDTRERAEEKVL